MTDTGLQKDASRRLPRLWGSGRREGLLVWLVLVAMAAFMLACIADAGRNIPLAEDWLLVPAYYGVESDLAQWLWAQNNEHRIPLPKLLMLGILHLTSGDFRAGMVVSVILMAAASAALIGAARSLRGGRIVWTDAVFPLLLLHPGNWENLVWAWQLTFTVSVALTLLLLAAVVRLARGGSACWSLAAAAALIALPLSGANGLVVTVAMAPWALYVGAVAPSRAGGRRPVAYIVLAIAAVLGLALTGAYFIGYERPSWVPPSPGIWQSVTTAGKIAALSWGPAGLAVWPLFALLTTLLAGSAGALLLPAGWRAWRSRDGQARATVLGMGGFLGAIGLLILLIGYSRAAYVPTIGVPTRYALFSAPMLCVAYLAWQMYGRRGVRAGQAILVVVVILILPLNVVRGFGWRAWYVDGMEAVETDLAAGMTPDDVAKRHRAFLLHWNEELLARNIKLLRDHGHPAFKPIVPASQPGRPPA